MQNPRRSTPSFGEAFKAARSAGKKTFTWKGKSYTTQTKEEAAKKGSAPKAPTRPAAPARPSQNPASQEWKDAQSDRVARENEMRRAAAERNRNASPYRRAAN